jgi:L-amino acid N-acyltransferase YncA
MLMARELYRLATRAGVEEIVVKMMRPQIAARKIFRRLGFQEEVLLPDYVKDRGGKIQDLIVMRCNLAALWQKLEDYFAHSDWQRTR